MWFLEIRVYKWKQRLRAECLPKNCDYLVVNGVTILKIKCLWWSNVKENFIKEGHKTDTDLICTQYNEFINWNKTDI